jgi:hypothetical protein
MVFKTLKQYSMKKITYLVLGIFVVMLYACDSQLDDAPNVGGLPTADFIIDNSDPNNVILKGASPDGFLYNWDLGNGANKQGETVTAYYPFSGSYNVTCTVSGKGGHSLITKTVTVASTDPELVNKPVLKELTGSGTGKTWVYYTDRPGWNVGSDPYPPNGYCFMVANYDWEEFWWDPYEDVGVDTPGVLNEIFFDLNGDYNYTFFSANGATGETGKFLIDTDAMTIHISNPWIPDYNEENLNPEKTATGDYLIKSVTDDELILYQDQGDDFGYGWIWIFKPKS